MMEFLEECVQGWGLGVVLAVTACIFLGVFPDDPTLPLRVYFFSGCLCFAWLTVNHVFPTCLYCGQPYVDKQLVVEANPDWHGPEGDF